MMRKKYSCAIILLAAALLRIHAWEDHTSLTLLALADSALKDIHLTVTSLEDFVSLRETELAAFLDSLESELAEGIPEYPPLPEHLRFGQGKEKDPVTRLFHALRINPEYRLQYFIKTSGGIPPADPERKEIDFKDIAYVHYLYPYSRFLVYEPGESIDALSVIATAADEPDYGLDIALFEDNGSPHGEIYGFGIQPFGNPDISYGSQAPFHMGFYNEAGIVYLAAPALRRSFPELRAIQFAALARFAFDQGDPYWGYRFAGWGLHYVQDLTMPYHASVMPGSSAAYLVWVGLLDLLGIKGPYDRVLTDVTNKHFLLEMIQLERINVLMRTDETGHPLPESFSGALLESLTASFGGTPVFEEHMLRTIISRNAKKAGKVFNNALEGVIKNRTLYGEIQALYETEGYDIYRIAHPPGTGEFEKLQEALILQMAELGRYTRAYLEYCLPREKYSGISLPICPPNSQKITTYCNKLV